MDGHWTMKLGLGVYQVIWYQDKFIVRGVQHVLSSCISIPVKVVYATYVDINVD